MPLDGDVQRAVSFIVGERSGAKTPIGTGFFGGEEIDGLTFAYLVTAAHVVSRENQTWVRLRKSTGDLVDEPVPEWFYHPTDDVAIAVFSPDVEHGSKPYEWSFIPSDEMVSHVGYRPLPGERVYFVGLFSVIPEMGERNVPMVRSGTVGALYQERVPMKFDSDPLAPVFHYTAHLIDCRAYAGFSGSPCFVQHEEWRPGTFTIGGTTGPGLAHGMTTYLLGLVSGHFDLMDKAKLTGTIGESGTVTVPVNIGIGVVMPSEAIRELLDEEEIVADRKQRKEEYEREEKKRKSTEAATGDSVLTPDEPFTKPTFYRDLTKATRRLDDEPEKGRS